MKRQASSICKKKVPSSAAGCVTWTAFSLLVNWNCKVVKLGRIFELWVIPLDNIGPAKNTDLPPRNLVYLFRIAGSVTMEWSPIINEARSHNPSPSHPQKIDEAHSYLHSLVSGLVDWDFGRQNNSKSPILRSILATFESGALNMIGDNIFGKCYELASHSHRFSGLSIKHKASHWTELQKWNEAQL